MKKLINGNEVELTEEEITAREERLSAKRLNIQQEEEAIQTKKASGKQKLKDLGLDDDEIKALMGA